MPASPTAITRTPIRREMPAAPQQLDFFLADGVPVTVYYPKGSLQRDYY